MFEHTIQAFSTFLSNPVYFTLTFSSFFFAIMILLFLRSSGVSSRKKILLIHAHLLLLLLPLALFSVTIPCMMTGMVWCDLTILQALIRSLLILMPLTLFSGLVLLPRLFSSSSRNQRVRGGPLFKQVKNLSEKMKIRNPLLFITDNAKPVAFSFSGIRNSSIFLSMGMTEILNRKELEAVILHELAHIKARTPTLKLSSLLLRFSPFSILKLFSSDLNEEERKADEFAIRTQGTDRHIISVKRKMMEFC